MCAGSQLTPWFFFMFPQSDHFFSITLSPETCVIPRPDYPVGMFFLTRRESLVIILVMVALTTGAGIRHLRMSAALPAEVR
jgi:hypothetical protein